VSAEFAESVASGMADQIERAVLDTHLAAASTLDYLNRPLVEHRVTQAADRLIQQAQRTRGRVNVVLNRHANGEFGDVTSQVVRSQVRDRIESEISADWRIRRTARTETAVTTNVAATDTFSLNGAVSVVIQDGPDCHLGPGHRVGPRANGLEVSIAQAQALPISHPNCVRTIAPV